MNLLIADSVTKRFHQGDQTVLALDAVSLSIPPGRFLAIMGASGSGKSTLLHLLAGLARADSGRILIQNQDLGAMSDRELTLFRRRHIGLVFQAFNLIPTLTAEENIALPLLLDGHSPRTLQPRVQSLLQTLGLQHRRRHRPDALSGGEQQRVAIGRALIGDASILLADEPTGNLDSLSSQSICQLLRELSVQHHKTVVMVTHEPAVAACADEVVILKDGRLIDHFPTASIPSLALRYQEAVQTSSASLGG